MPEDTRHELGDLTTDLVAKANSPAGRLHPSLRAELGNLVRSMNCYYSNLIEGHDTHPIDIDRELAGNYADDPKRGDLQREAVAHIDVQRRIDWVKPHAGAGGAKPHSRARTHSAQSPPEAYARLGEDKALVGEIDTFRNAFQKRFGSAAINKNSAREALQSLPREQRPAFALETRMRNVGYVIRDQAQALAQERGQGQKLTRDWLPYNFPQLVVLCSPKINLQLMLRGHITEGSISAHFAGA